MSKLFRLVKEKVAGSGFSPRVTFLFVISKGFWPLIRGVLLTLLYPKIKKPFFLGRLTKINFKSKLRTGKFCYIGDYSILNCLSLNGVVLGDRVTIREFGWLQLTSQIDKPGVGIVIGDNTYIGPRVYLGAAEQIMIGDRCQIGGNVSFIAESHNFKDADKEIFEQGVSRKGIFLGDDCWIGNNSIILDGVKLGKGCVVGAGAVVTRSFDDYSVISGCPAKLMYKRNEH